MPYRSPVLVVIASFTTLLSIHWSTHNTPSLSLSDSLSSRWLYLLLTHTLTHTKTQKVKTTSGSVSCLLTVNGSLDLSAACDGHRKWRELSGADRPWQCVEIYLLQPSDWGGILYLSYELHMRKAHTVWNWGAGHQNPGRAPNCYDPLGRETY